MLGMHLHPQVEETHWQDKDLLVATNHRNVLNDTTLELCNDQHCVKAMLSLLTETKRAETGEYMLNQKLMTNVWAVDIACRK